MKEKEDSYFCVYENNLKKQITEKGSAFQGQQGLPIPLRPGAKTSGVNDPSFWSRQTKGSEAMEVLLCVEGYSIDNYCNMIRR